MHAERSLEEYMVVRAEAMVLGNGLDNAANAVVHLEAHVLHSVKG